MTHVHAGVVRNTSIVAGGKSMVIDNEKENFEVLKTQIKYLKECL